MIGKEGGNVCRKKTGLFDLVKYFIEMLFDKLESNAGKVNISVGLLLLFLVAILTISPGLYYFLLIIQTICNTVLQYYGKDLIQISESSPSLTLLIACVIIFLIESIICTVVVYKYEKELLNKTN